MTKVVVVHVIRVGAQSVSRLGALCVSRVRTQYVTGVRFSQESLILKSTFLSLFDEAGRVTGLLDFSGQIRYEFWAPSVPMA